MVWWKGFPEPCIGWFRCFTGQVDLGPSGIVVSHVSFAETERRSSKYASVEVKTIQEIAEVVLT